MSLYYLVLPSAVWPQFLADRVSQVLKSKASNGDLFQHLRIEKLMGCRHEGDKEKVTKRLFFETKTEINRAGPIGPMLTKQIHNRDIQLA
jgi:hypothetical protein